jgi:hypothetical protein
MPKTPLYRNRGILASMRRGPHSLQSHAGSAKLKGYWCKCNGCLAVAPFFEWTKPHPRPNLATDTPSIPCPRAVH